MSDYGSGFGPMQGMGLDERNRFEEALSQLSPEELDALIQGGLADDKLGLLGQKMSMAQGMMGQSPQGTATPGGGYVASNPLQHLAAGIGNYMGAQGMKDAMAGMSDVVGGKGNYLQTVLKMLRKKKGMGGNEPTITAPNTDPLLGGLETT